MRNVAFFVAVQLAVLLIIYSVDYVYFSNPFSVLMKREENVHFDGEEYWEQSERDMCDNPELDETWKYGDSVCVIYQQNFQLVKMEILSWVPPLVIYRNFFTQNQVEDYLNLIEKEQMEEQEVMDANGDSFLSEVRKANGTPTPAHSFPQAQSLTNTATRLIPAIDFSISEDILALSYNAGGHYATHFDYLNYEAEEDWDHYTAVYGNRLATFIMVFKRSGLGGGTLFPDLRTVVRADPGDAFLWFNSKGSLEIEDLSVHGGCPVHSGQKVISTIWIRTTNQPILKRWPYNSSFHTDLLIPKM